MDMKSSVKEQHFDTLMNMASNLSREQLSVMAEHIMNLMAKTQPENLDACHKLVVDTNPEIPNCPHCGAKSTLGYIIKRGRKPNGAQRYGCKFCGKTFVPTTKTAFARSKKGADVWQKFIRMTISGAGLHACSKGCHVSYQTAFTWRHKILNVFVENQKSTKMSGTVEADEMFIPISYKGNHIQGNFGTRKKAPGAINDMPRKSYRRGTDNISCSSKDKSCVFCMVENGNKAFYAAVPGVGGMDKAMLDATVGKHVDKEKVHMLVDNYRITRKYFEENGYNHTILASNTSDNPKDHKPEIKDGLHIQHVNAMHRHIRKFLAPYCGVSSKYLSHYLALFVWLKTVGVAKQRKTVDKVSVARAATPDCYITRRQLHSRPALPQCA